MNKNQLFRFAIIREPDQELTPDAITENSDAAMTPGTSESPPINSSEDRAGDMAGGTSSPSSNSSSAKSNSDISPVESKGDNLDAQASECLKLMENLFAQLVKSPPKNRDELKKKVVDILGTDPKRLVDCKRLLWESLRNVYLADKPSQRAHAAHTRALRACAVAEAVEKGGLLDEKKFEVELRQLLRKPVLIRARRPARPTGPPAKYSPSKLPTIEELRSTLGFLRNPPSTYLSRRFESIDTEVEYKTEASKFRMSLVKLALDVVEVSKRKDLELLLKQADLPAVAIRVPRRVLTDEAVRHIPRRVVEALKEIGVDMMKADLSVVRNAVRRLHRDVLRRSLKLCFAVPEKGGASS